MATSYQGNVTSLAQSGRDAAAAPVIRTIGFAELGRALRRGWEDFKAVPSHAIILCVIYPVLGLVLARTVLGYSVLPLLFPLAAGFALLGPFAALGLYELSRRRETGAQATAWDALEVLRSPSFGAMLGLGVLLLALFVTWVATAQAIYIAAFGYEGATGIRDFVTHVVTTSEGWWLIPARYDDGAFSGASLERPALQQLLSDVRAGKVDILLVYKVDRLTRSLADFAKLIELFDVHGVSFVSVTQSFNTSSSMGRLTLNVLLSFAQFERELIGERVRDKIAASKRKGLWVGGPVPLGYAAVDKKILVVPAEAAAVRTIFARYLELGSVRALAEDLDRRGIRSKPRRFMARPSRVSA